MKLLQWNIWNNEKVENIAKELKRFDADVACLQEVCITQNDFSTINKLNQVYPFVYFAVAEHFTNGRIQGNAILSKYKLHSKQRSFVRKRSGKLNNYAGEGRIFISAKIKIDNKTICIGTTHLSFTPNLQETAEKDLEIKKLLKILKRHRKHFIFAGDLNAGESSKYVKQIEKLLTRCDTSNTWTTKPFSYQGFVENELNWKIDHVFTSSDLVVKNAKVMKTKFSDHLPIMAEIDL